MCDMKQDQKEFLIAKRNINIYKMVGDRNQPPYAAQSKYRNSLSISLWHLPPVLKNELKNNPKVWSVYGNTGTVVVQLTKGLVYRPGWEYTSLFTESLGLWCYLKRNTRFLKRGWASPSHLMAGYIPKGTRYLLGQSRNVVIAERLVLTEDLGKRKINR